MYSGVTRPIDKLGRIVIPKEIRKKYNIKDGDVIEFGCQGGEITLRKYYPYDEVTAFLDDVEVSLNVTAVNCNLSDEKYKAIEKKIDEIRELFDL